jgi:hypothetical protein
MSTMSFRIVLAGLALAVMGMEAAAQDRSRLLTSIEVQRMVASGRSDDHIQLRDHFAALADEYAKDASSPW